VFKLDNYGLCLTNSFIHPRNITSNIYHSLYHIIHFKVVQKLLGLRYSFGAWIKRRFCICVFENCSGDDHPDGISNLLGARKCQMPPMISVQSIRQSSSQCNFGVTRGTVYQVSKPNKVSTKSGLEKNWDEQMRGNDIKKEINYSSWFSLPGLFFYENSNETETLIISLGSTIQLLHFVVVVV